MSRDTHATRCRCPGCRGSLLIARPVKIVGEDDLPGVNDLMIVDRLGRFVCNVDDADPHRSLIMAKEIAQALNRFPHPTPESERVTDPNPTDIIQLPCSTCGGIMEVPCDCEASVCLHENNREPCPYCGGEE